MNHFSLLINLQQYCNTLFPNEPHLSLQSMIPSSTNVLPSISSNLSKENTINGDSNNNNKNNNNNNDDIKTNIPSKLSTKDNKNDTISKSNSNKIITYDSNTNKRNNKKKEKIEKVVETEEDRIKYFYSDRDENVPEQYLKLLDEEYKELMEINKSNGWKHIMNENKVNVYQREHKGMLCGKGEGIIENVNTLATISFLKLLNRRKEWDVMLDETNTKILVNYNKHCMISRSCFKKVFPTSARDFVTINQTRYLGDGKFVVLSKSITTPLCPEVNGIVRAQLILGGFIISPTGPNNASSNVIYITQANLNGYIPSSIQKSMFLII